MSYGNYINLLNWNCRGLESLNQGHPNFAQLRAVLASCLELEGWISLIIADLLFNTELQLMQISSKMESKTFLVPALQLRGGYSIIIMYTMESTAFPFFSPLSSVCVHWFQDKLAWNVKFKLFFFLSSVSKTVIVSVYKHEVIWPNLCLSFHLQNKLQIVTIWFLVANSDNA